MRGGGEGKIAAIGAETDRRMYVFLCIYVFCVRAKLGNILYSRVVEKKRRDVCV